MSQNKMRLTRGELTDMVGRHGQFMQGLLNFINSYIEYKGDKEGFAEELKKQEEKARKAKENEKDEK